MNYILILRAFAIVYIKCFVLAFHSYPNSLRNNQLLQFKRKFIMNTNGFGKSKLNNKKNEDSISSKNNIDIKDRSSIQKDKILNITQYCPSLNLNYPGLRCINKNPLIFEIDDFFDNDLCNQYIQRAQAHGKRYNSQTFAASTAVQRTSTTWYMNYHNVPELLHNANKLTGRSIETFEEPQVVCYELGQQFSWHYDAIPSSLNNNGGQRLITLIVYLNDVSIGGATCFKDLNIQVKPKTGKALLFFPCLADGTPDDRTMHAGQVAGDTKWIAQIWLHENNYLPKIPEGNNHMDGIESIKLMLNENNTII